VVTLRMNRPLTSLALAAVAGLGLSCGGGAARSTVDRLRASIEPPPPPPAPIPEMLDYAASLGVNVADMKKLPEGVLYDDVSAGGDSATAVTGDSVEIRYEGWLPNGTKVDSGTAALRLGGGGMLQGVELAVPGMRAGAKRKLVLPPGLGYGADGTETVPPNSVLVYDVELRRIIR